MKISAIFLLTAGHLIAQGDDYQKGPDSTRKQGVPAGELHEFVWDKSNVYPGTSRNYWVHVPAQYDASSPAAVLICQDGQGFVRENGHTNVPAVLDNLIHSGEVPVTIGIFINPGVVPATQENQQPRKNRSYEYDSLSNLYATFLIDEILAEVGTKWNLTSDPKRVVICGNSSGGIAAFTAAWERPDVFGNVISHIGSFTNIRGGHAYPALIRKTEPKPIRVFLQEGENDLDNLHGNWPLANRQMEAALQFAGYDFKMVWGTGGHSGRHGGAIFPDTLRWIFRDWKS